MKPSKGYVYCITTTTSPDEFLTNENDEILVFNSDEEIKEWAFVNQVDLDIILVHEVEVLDD